MGTPKPNADPRTTPADAVSGSSGAAPQQAAPQEAAPQQAAPQEAAPQQAAPQEAAPQEAAPQQARTRQADRPAVAVVVVPTLLGLLGFFAVAAAVTADAATVNVTVPGLLLALTALVVAGISPLYAANPTWVSLRRPTFLLAICLLVDAALFLFAPQLVLFSIPALPLALGGGAVLLATSLWGQFRKGPVPEPALIPRREAPARPFTSMLLVVAVSWALFLAAGVFCAWLLLGD